MKSTAASSETKTAAMGMPSITYKLSNEIFKTLGWTSLPQNAIVVPVVTMKGKFSHDVVSPWLRGENRTYKDGRRLCASEENGTGRIYYPNGRLAIWVKRGENGMTRIIVKTPGGIGKDGVRRRSQLCAIFDSLGNGVVYDCDKSKRLVYDQHHGIAWLKRNRMPIYWKWHNLNGTEESSEKEMARSRAKWKDMSVVFAMKELDDPPIAKNEVTVSETPSVQQSDNSDGNYVDTSRNPTASPIRPIIFQINSFVGVRIFRQSDIALTFFAEGQQTRLNIGTLYNPYEKFTTDKIFALNINEKVWCPFEVLPMKTRSMEILRQRIKKEKTAPCWNLN